MIKKYRKFICHQYPICFHSIQMSDFLAITILTAHPIKTVILAKKALQNLTHSAFLPE